MTIRELAERLHVSPATVSRVLNHKADRYISQATRDRVLALAKELDYRPNRAAQGLVTGRSNLVAVWMPNLYESFYSAIIHLMQAHSEERGLDTIVRETRSSVDPRFTRAFASQWPVDGILACDYIGTREEFFSASRGTPTVTMGSYFLEDTHYVGVDLYKGAFAAVSHLVAQGRKRIALVTPLWGCDAADARRAGSTAAMISLDRPLEMIITADHTRLASRDAVAARLAEGNFPDAIFCRNDAIAIGAYRALRDAGVRVPDDVAVIGCDGIEDTEFLDTPLTTIVQPIHEMVFTAWEFLSNVMANPDIPLQHAMLEPRLEIRASTG